ncbi:hypothetical protein HMPREF1323_1200 [Porphyromonas sp. oral taxon 279 str. F0450]|nr:hypothetical protein HMPREF1323_1200 [Porphyromonas sp. oral taxon 279 str. F0450]
MIYTPLISHSEDISGVALSPYAMGRTAPRVSYIPIEPPQ